IDDIFRICSLPDKPVIADIGAGTGKLTKLLIEQGAICYAVEPNDAMRRLAERELKGLPVHLIAASAEETTLEDNSVDLITVAQAFHWFDHAACRREFARILRNGGRVVLIWNKRDTTDTAMIEFARIIEKHCSDLPQHSHGESYDEVIKDFYKGGFFIKNTYPYEQALDFESFWGRVQSASYTPPPSHPEHHMLKAALFDYFNRFNEGGYIHFKYNTQVYIGVL
ncbi:MAG TPA: methyltransferase domain-containing protein, partial [Clostridia bacterium]|nr:methyltransferase domain-containing protein [Clostridia bacterium]